MAPAPAVFSDFGPPVRPTWSLCGHNVPAWVLAIPINRGVPLAALTSHRRCALHRGGPSL